MRYDWDPAKRISNLAKHGVDFASVEFFEWDEALVLASTGSNDPRLVALAPITRRLHVLIYSIETRSVRVISLRKANKREVQLWRSAT